MELKTANYLKERQVIRLVFPISTIDDLNSISLVRTGSNIWETPVSIRTVQLLLNLNFVFSKSLKNFQQENQIKKKSAIKPKIAEKLPIPDEKLKLYHFQKVGINFIEKKKGRCLIADEMGLGKTIQSLAWLCLHPEIRPVLIICPASLKYNWYREVQKWIGVHSQILSGTIPNYINENIVIINYDIIAYWYKQLKEMEFKLLILDEAHYIKNNQAKRTKTFKKLIYNIPKLIALTGTPIENRPVEIYNIVKAIDPLLFPNFVEFVEEYCNAKKTRFGWDTSGASHTLKLNRILKSTIMIRRKKIDVLKELPPKNIVKVPIQIDNEKEYKKAENEFINFLKDKYHTKIITDDLKKELKEYAVRNKIEISKNPTDEEIRFVIETKFQRINTAPILAQIETLKQLSIKGKLKQIKDWINTFLESDEKLVIFLTHQKTMDYFIHTFPDAVKIDGSVPIPRRQELIDKFQNDKKTKLFFGNIYAAGTGITLTAASNVAIIEFPWSPGTLVQAADRVHRITQTKQVTVWNLVGADTIEERIIDLLCRKEKIIYQVLDGKKDIDSSIFNDLIKSYKK